MPRRGFRERETAPVELVRVIKPEQWRQLEVIARVERGVLEPAAGARQLGMTMRQLQRKRTRIKASGPIGILHGNVGRPPATKTAPAIAAQVIALWREKYAGCSDVRFADMLLQEEGLDLKRATVRRILRRAGLGPGKGRGSSG
jgi:hypothetical protein